MKAPGQTTARVLRGSLLVGLCTLVLVFLYAMLRPSEADLRRAAAELREERQPAVERDPSFAWPEMTRWDFVTHLPVPGAVNRYRWRAYGKFAYALDRDRDRIVHFRLETLDREEPVEIVSAIAVFDKKARLLSTEAPTRMTLSWGTVHSDRMCLELNTADAVFDGNVLVEVIQEKAPGGGLLGPDEESGSPDDEGAAGGDGEETPPKKRPPLRITAEHFEIHSAEDKGIFTGDVVAKDETGTIWADTMIVEYYTAEERKADPSRVGMKRVTCVGHVRIDQGIEQAKCEKAIYVVETNVITLLSTETTQVLYRKETEEEKHQVLSDKVVIWRDPPGKTEFVGNVEAVDFSETRESFFGEESGEDEGGEEEGGSDDDGAPGETSDE